MRKQRKPPASLQMNRLSENAIHAPVAMARIAARAQNAFSYLISPPRPAGAPASFCVPLLLGRIWEQPSVQPAAPTTWSSIIAGKYYYSDDVTRLNKAAVLPFPVTSAEDNPGLFSSTKQDKQHSAPSPAEEDDVQFVDLTPPKDGLDPQLGTDGDDVEIKTFLGSCREERLESLAQLLPKFQPSLDVTTWLWGSLEQLKSRSLPFGTQNVQDKIAQLASERSESSNLLWSPIKTNEENDNCDPQASKKCVVVGNSYALLHSNLGRTIDAHDVVMRFNTAPATPKYALDVGRKTTVRFFYPESAELVAKEASALAYSSSRARAGQKNGPSPPSDYYMMTFYKPDDVEWLLLADSQKSEGEKTNAFSKLRFWKDVPAPGEVAALADHIRVMNPELLFETKSLANLDGIPTSGLYAIVLALHECSLPVSIAGFAYTINPKDPMHYYDRKLMGDILDPKNAGKHGVGTERAFIDKLIKMGVVRDLMKK